MNPLRISTYHHVWGLKRLIYHIQRLRLPVPVRLPDFVLFVGFEAAALLPVFRFIAWGLRFGFFPPLLTLLFARAEVDGRPVFDFLVSLVRFNLSPHQFCGGRALPRKDSYPLTVSGSVTHIIFAKEESEHVAVADANRTESRMDPGSTVGFLPADPL